MTAPYHERLDALRQRIPPPERSKSVDELRRFDHEPCFGMGYERGRNGVDPETGDARYRRIKCSCALGLTCPTCRGARKVRKFEGFDAPGRPLVVGTGQVIWCPDCSPKGEFSPQSELDAVERELARLVAEEVDTFVPF